MYGVMGGRIARGLPVEWTVYVEVVGRVSACAVMFSDGHMRWPVAG